VKPQEPRTSLPTETIWRDLENEFHFLTGSEVIRALGAKSQNRNHASYLRRKGELLGVIRLNAYRYPGFQFDGDGAIHPAIKHLVSAMREGGWSDESFILWLCSPSRAFPDGGRPVDYLDDPNLVQAAVEMMAVDW